MRYNLKADKIGAGAGVPVLFGPAARNAFAGANAAIPQKGGLLYIPDPPNMDKDSREALQVAKELTCKFIETRTVSPGNFAEVFPVIFKVVSETIREAGERE